MNPRTARAAVLGLLALIFLAFHFRFLPQSLEDLDSINFALGVRHYDVAEHQPHPPGYPLYILIAKGVRKLAGSELLALTALGIIAGAAGVVAIAVLAGRIDERGGESWPIAATAIAISSPLYWFTASRPLSDMPGLAAAISVQAMTLAATTRNGLFAAAFCAAVATGIRSQIAWLTVPLIVYVAVVRHARSSTNSTGSLVQIARVLVQLGLILVAGVLVWFIPLVALTGGLARYWSALSFQGSADIGNIQMLWTRHRPRDVADALYYAFVAPWATWPLASVVLVLAILGFVMLTRRVPRALFLLLAAFGPYFMFDLLFQETFTSRYALPLVIPIGYLAAAGARILPWRSGIAAVAAVAMYSAHLGGTSLAAFAREKAPAFRLLDDMARASTDMHAAPVLAMDRKQSFDFRRPITWQDGAMASFSRVLPVPPQHEWLEAVKYWAGGGTAPVLFVVDPKRSMIDLVQHGDPVRYRWALPHPVLVGGARPDEMDYYRVDSPEWFVGEGWALTPEAAGISDADHRGPNEAPIEAWLTNRLAGGVVMIGGRNFSPRPATLSFDVDDDRLEPLFPAFDAPPGAFLRLIRVPALLQPVTPGYVRMLVRSSRDSRVAIEQFDASAERAVMGFGDGWQEQEFNPRTGRRWRWLSERGELRFAPAVTRATLHVEGESPRAYFSRASHLVMRAGSQIILDRVLDSDFSFDVPVQDGSEAVTLETDQVFQPADRSRRSADRRHLGLRIFTCELRTAR